MGRASSTISAVAVNRGLAVILFVMKNLLKNRGYDDWAGDVSGYGKTLEITVYAVREKKPGGIPASLKRQDEPLPAERRTGPRDERATIAALENFSKAFGN